MCTRFIGCLHFGHFGIAKYRGFEESFLHDEWLIFQWNKVVNKKDLTFILGDITMESSKTYCLLNRLQGRKKVVLGNHDLNKHVPELLKYVESVAGMIDYKGCALTHAPIHPSEIGQYRLNIHAHIHHKNKLEEVSALSCYNDEGSLPIPSLHKYRNVDAHLINYTPKTLEELLNQKI